MTTELNRWLDQATRCLAADSTARVRTEILEHFESACEAATLNGATPEEAERLALAALGRPKEANRGYRKVLLTQSEARLLREGNWEYRAICSNALLRTPLFSIPVIALVAGLAFLLSGARDLGRDLAAAGAGVGLIFLTPYLPIYTRSRSRVARIMKWLLLVAMPIVILGPDIRRFSWLLIASLSPALAMEWSRVTIRRKLPIDQWPRHLYW